jgi:hypothetical protein
MEESGVHVPTGQINYNTVAGSLGLASFLGVKLPGLFGQNGNCDPCADKFVTQKEMDYEKEIIRQTGEISRLESGKYADQNIIAAYKDVVARFKESDEKFAQAQKEDWMARIENEKAAARMEARLQCLEERMKAQYEFTDQKIGYEVKALHGAVHAAKDELRGAIALEAERRECGDKSLYAYVNATFVPGKMIMPASSVCPQPMPQYNSWTAPTTATTATPAGA